MSHISTGSKFRFRAVTFLNFKNQSQKEIGNCKWSVIEKVIITVIITVTVIVIITLAIFYNVIVIITF